MTIVFGPVPSRRLGISLGINNVPYKYCTYSCIYCQLGRTTKMIMCRRRFYDPKKIVEEVKTVLGKVKERVDYVTFVPDGEPTLDINLGKTIRMLKQEISIPIAIITNASLLWRSDVVNDVIEADLVSVKVDAGDECTWRKINRPHPELEFQKIVNGLIEFSKEYKGKLITETMLIENMNIVGKVFEKIINLISMLSPWKTYLAIPIRPPTEKWVKAPTPLELIEAYNIAISKLGENKVYLLNMPEPPEFIIGDNVKEYILSTSSVHPIRYDYLVQALLDKGVDPKELLKELLREKLIEIVEYNGVLFILRKFSQRHKRGNDYTSIGY